MFGHFYNASIRSYIVLLSELLGHVQVKRKRNNENKYIKVPISYVSKEHFYQKMNSAFANAGDDPKKLAKIETILPRMSIQLVDMMYDETFKTSIHNTKFRTKDSKLKSQFNPVPYKFTFQVGIYTRFEDDMFQILEQIVPYFQPTFNCKIKELYNNDIVIDRVVPVTATSIILDEDLEGDKLSRRKLEWTITIELQGWLYPAAAQLQGEIRTVYIDFFENQKELSKDTQFESVDFQVDPVDTDPETWDGSVEETYTNNIPIPKDPIKPGPRHE